MTTKKTHYVSGAIIFTFVVLHLFNHLFSLSGPGRHIAVMEALRVYYRHPVAETILLTAVAIQLFTGFHLYRNPGRNASTKFHRLQRWTGLYLAFFLIIHLSAVFGARFLLQLDTNFYFGVAGLNTFPFNLFFIPYYGLAITAFFGHLAAIHGRKMSARIFGLRPESQAKAILAVGVLLALLTMCGLTDHFRGVEIPGKYALPHL